MISAACLIAKNEGAYIKEWLAYYDAIGFSRLIVLDNNSTDNTADVALGAAGSVDLQLIPWSDVSPFWQVSAYEHVIRETAKDADWIGFFDADEFLRLGLHASITDFLDNLASYNAIGLPWRIYGSSGFKESPGGLVVENYQHRSSRTFGPNHHIKSLLRPRAVKRMLNPHAAEIVGSEEVWSERDGRTGYNWPTGEPIIWHGGTAGLAENLPAHDSAWINHYFVKSESDWRSKVARGYNGWMRDAESFAAYNQSSEIEPFPDILINAVRERLGRFW